MQGLQKIVRGDASRRTRWHTVNNVFCPYPFEFLNAAVGAALRHAVDYRPRSPWLPPSVLPVLDSLARGGIVFEYGSGSSTAWLARRARKVFSVEHNQEWHSKVSGDLAELSNVEALLVTPEKYPTAIEELASEPALVIIDGIARSACLHEALSVRAAAILVDNTDVDPLLRAEAQLNTGYKTQFFYGYPKATPHANETAIMRRI